MMLRLMVPLAFGAWIAGAMVDDCDLKTIEAGFFCDMCDSAFLKADLVSDVTYYQCGECEAVSHEAGTCESCESTLQKKTSGKSVCPGCFQKPQDADLCVKTYYECPGCNAVANAAGTCKACEETLTKQISRAVVSHECSECGGSAYKPSKCDDEDCARTGKPRDTKSCSMSGVPPHVKTAK